MLGRSSAAVLLSGIAVMPIQSTPDRRQDDWVPLFDGKTLTGWRGYKKPDASSTRWKIEDGTLTIDARRRQRHARRARRHHC